MARRLRLTPVAGSFLRGKIMGFEHKPNSGSIFHNRFKEKDAQPDWTGTALIEGVEYRLAAWENEGRENIYLSIKFEKKSDWDARTSRSDVQTRRADPESNTPRDRAGGSGSAGGRDPAYGRYPDPERARAAVQKARDALKGRGADPGTGLMPGENDFADDDIPF